MREFMYIEKIFPAKIANKSTLKERLTAEAKYLNLTNIDEFISIIPENLIKCGAFLDIDSNCWRYEFGIPYEIGNDIVWGTHMWIPVQYLFNALLCVYSRLQKDKSSAYMKRLADPTKHQATLVEMIPANNLHQSVDAQFEIAGLGLGNNTFDWVIGPQNDRMVFLDVKRRTVDFIHQIENLDNRPIAPEPQHDPANLFRSVEKKFKSADPQLHLQGVWIITDIKQNEKLLTEAFSALNTDKVHFAILGDWKSDAYVLVKRTEDEEYLRGLFNLKKSDRFTFIQETS